MLSFDESLISTVVEYVMKLSVSNKRKARETICHHREVDAPAWISGLIKGSLRYFFDGSSSSQTMVHDRM